jgi:hypothetical protein
MNRKVLSAVLVAAALVAVPSTVHAWNVLVDPRFERQTPPDQGGWILFGGAFSTDQARSGHWSMLDRFCGVYGGLGSYEQFPAAPGSRWRLTGYGLVPASIVGDPGAIFGIIQVTFFDASGNDLGTLETVGAPFPAKTSAHLDAMTFPLQWQFLDTDAVTAPAGAAFVQAFTLWIDFTGRGECQGASFDDLRLDVLGLSRGQYVDSIERNAMALRRSGILTELQAEAMVEAAERAADRD